MLSEQIQLEPFDFIVDTLHKLCVERRSGTLYLVTNQRQGATFTLSQGNIIDIAYLKDRGMQALEQIKSIRMAQCLFKNVSALRDKSAEYYLPASNVILSKLGVTSSPLSSEGGIKKILIVEDSGLSRKSIINLFAGKSYDIVEAIDGLEALDKLERGGADLVLLDLILPKMNGYEVLSAMKKNIALRKIPVIVLTSRGALLDKLKGRMSGTDEYLTKPVNAKELKVLVRKYLSDDE